jgi:hypothetical protein
MAGGRDLEDPRRSRPTARVGESVLGSGGAIGKTPRRCGLVDVDRVSPPREDPWSSRWALDGVQGWRPSQDQERDAETFGYVVGGVVVGGHACRGGPGEVVVQQLLQRPLGKATSASAWSKQAIARWSISSCEPLPLWMRTTAVSSP